MPLFTFSVIESELLLILWFQALSNFHFVLPFDFAAFEWLWSKLRAAGQASPRSTQFLVVGHTAQWTRLSPEINNNVPVSWTILGYDFLVRKPAKETRSPANK